jgi:CRP-like cAMP-binding protein
MQTVPCDLDRCFLCRNCIPEWKQLIALQKKTLFIRKGKPLFREGEKVEGLFFLYSGTVKVHILWTDEKEMILRFARPGDIIGYRGLGGDVYPVSATALEDVQVCFVSAEFFEATLRTNPSLTFTLMHLYAGELQKTERRLRDLAHKEVKSRVAAALLEISELFGLDKDRYISVTLTRQDIASYAGTTYETVFKFFGELERGKVISTDGKRIRINKPERLRVLVG